MSPAGSSAGAVSPSGLGKLLGRQLRKDPAESGRDRSHCPRQFTSASNQQLAARSKCFKHYAHPFSASHMNRKLCYKPHNFVPIYLPTPVCMYVCIDILEPSTISVAITAHKGCRWRRPGVVQSRVRSPRSNILAAIKVRER